jgi:hypothetical protein
MPLAISAEPGMKPNCMFKTSLLKKTSTENIYKYSVVTIINPVISYQLVEDFFNKKNVSTQSLVLKPSYRHLKSRRNYRHIHIL